MSDNPIWTICIDTGGTFTDCVATAPDGRELRVKILSSSALRGVLVKRLSRAEFLLQQNWQADAGLITGMRFRLLQHPEQDCAISDFDPQHSRIALASPLPEDLPLPALFEVYSDEEAPVLAARLITGTAAGAPLPPMQMRLATTRGTNALLERKGVAVALFITRGHADLLAIGTQQRPDLFALDIRKPRPLYSRVIEMPERLAADGSIVQPLDVEALRPQVRQCLREGIRSAAVVLMHSYRNPQHEQALAEFLRREGFEHISCSAELAPFIRILPRAATTVVDAYLAPVIGDYLDNVAGALSPDSTLHVMTSAGGLMRAGAYRAKDSLLSGPAGGVAGAAFSGKAAGYDKIIAFDMGGTSTDVSRFDGEYEYVFEHLVGDAHLMSPALAIETVAAGGGSICQFDGRRLRVGPESAGADPGPACYGAGGPLTITDVNLLAGRLSAERFGIPVRIEAAQQALQRIIEALQRHSGEKPQPETLLAGFLDIANERMAEAIRHISLRRGYDPADYALVAFGGAGAQNACAVADLLGVRTVVVPTDASLLSAVGLRHAAIERFAERQILQPLQALSGHLAALIAELSAEAIAAVRQEGVHQPVSIRRRMMTLRLAGQDTSLTVNFQEDSDVRELFVTEYNKLYGHQPPERTIEVESIRVVAAAEPPLPADELIEPAPAGAAEPDLFQRGLFAGKWQHVPVFEREKLRAGVRIVGPALIYERHSAVVVEDGWLARQHANGSLILQKG